MELTFVKEKHPLSIHVVWMFILIAVLVFAHFMPVNKCLFHEFTGYPCLSCGATRAAEALFQGDLVGMVSYNPLIVLFCAGLFFFSLFKFAEFIFRFRVNLRLNGKYLRVLRVFVLIAVIINWAFLILMGR